MMLQPYRGMAPRHGTFFFASLPYSVRPGPARECATRLHHGDDARCACYDRGGDSSDGSRGSGAAEISVLS